jgi:hypothetical protein
VAREKSLSFIHSRAEKMHRVQAINSEKEIRWKEVANSRAEKLARSEKQREQRFAEFREGRRRQLQTEKQEHLGRLRERQEVGGAFPSLAVPCWLGSAYVTPVLVTKYVERVVTPAQDFETRTLERRQVLEGHAHEVPRALFVPPGACPCLGAPVVCVVACPVGGWVSCPHGDALSCVP